MFRGGVGFTPKWMAMNPKTYTTKTDHHGVMAQNRCGRDDLIGIQKKEQGRDVPSFVKQPQQPQQPQQQQATTTSTTTTTNTSGMNQEQKRVKRKRDLLLQNLSDLDSQEDRAKRRRQEEKNLERRTVPTHLLFKR